MLKRICFYLFLLCMFTLSACQNKTKVEEDSKAKIYKLAQEAGYEGTYEEWLNTIKGKDGITPKLRINSDTNYWEVSYNGGITWTSLDIKATGDNGDKGESVYDLFKKYHPDYNGTEEQWIDSIYNNYLYYKENAPETGVFTYARSENGNTYIITSYTGEDESISIPSYYNGYMVSGVKSMDLSNAKRIVIPETLKYFNCFNKIKDNTGVIIYGRTMFENGFKVYSDFDIISNLNSAEIINYLGKIDNRSSIAGKQYYFLRIYCNDVMIVSLKSNGDGTATYIIKEYD